MSEQNHQEPTGDFRVLLAETEELAEEEGITAQLLAEMDAINEMRLMAESLSAPLCHYSTSS